MGKSEGKRGRSTDNVSIRSVLGSVARAHELVVGGRPWDDATQVSADCDSEYSSRCDENRKRKHEVRNQTGYNSWQGRESFYSHSNITISKLFDYVYSKSYRR